MTGTGSVFKEWAVLELMGHRRLAGEVSEATIGGVSFVRIDVPEIDGQAPFTQYYTGPAIYAITPTTEDVARKLAKAWAYQPVSKWELREPVNAVLGAYEEGGSPGDSMGPEDDDAP